MRTFSFKSDKLNGQSKVLLTLTKRHLMMFFKNKLTFFFSLLVPLITLLVYVLFLRTLELSTVDSILQQYNLTGDKTLVSKVYGLCDAWMLSGILAVSCITVSLNTCLIIIQDKESGANKDFISSPIKKSMITVSYFIFNFLVTLIICLVLLVICFIYIAAFGLFYFSFSDVISIIAVICVSIIVSTLSTVLVVSFMNSGSTFTSLTATMSAGIGFLIGAYMPINMLPSSVQYLTLFFPGTYSAGIFRNLFLRGQFASLSSYMVEHGSVENPTELLEEFNKNFDTSISFFGIKMNSMYMALVLVIFIAIFLALNLVFTNRNLTNVSLERNHKAKKAK